MRKVVAVMATITAVYVFVASTCVLLYYTHTMATWSNSAASAAVNGVLNWVTLAGNWAIQLLW